MNRGVHSHYYFAKYAKFKLSFNLNYLMLKYKLTVLLARQSVVLGNLEMLKYLKGCCKLIYHFAAAASSASASSLSCIINLGNLAQILK